MMSHVRLRFGGLGTVLCPVDDALGLVVAMDRWLLATPVWAMAHLGYVAEKGTIAGDLIRSAGRRVRARACRRLG